MSLEAVRGALLAVVELTKIGRGLTISGSSGSQCRQDSEDGRELHVVLDGCSGLLSEDAMLEAA